MFITSSRRGDRGNHRRAGGAGVPRGARHPSAITFAAMSSKVHDLTEWVRPLSSQRATAGLWTKCYGIVTQAEPSRALQAK
jgi:hypothetical protein